MSATAAAAALAATDRRARDWFLLFGLGSALFAMISYAIGCGLQRLQRWAQSTIAAASLIAIATLVVVFAASPENVTALVIGLAGCGYFLYTVSGAGGRMVFSDEYRETIAKTPQIRYRVSIVVSLPLAILIASYACSGGGCLERRVWPIASAMKARLSGLTWTGKPDLRPPVAFTPAHPPVRRG